MTDNDKSCSVCHDEPSIGVACVPGVPFSAAYGRKCLAANAHPWGVLVANTNALGGWHNAAEWWKEMVTDTCNHLGKTLDEFKEDVLKNEREWRST